MDSHEDRDIVKSSGSDEQGRWGSKNSDNGGGVGWNVHAANSPFHDSNQ